MYNVIFTMVDVRNFILKETAEYFRKNFDFVRPLPESRKVNNRIMYQANIPSIEGIKIIKSKLEGLGATPKIVGVWKTKGSSAGLQQGYKFDELGENGEPTYKIIRATIVDEKGKMIPEPISFPFDFDEYHLFLNDVVEYDFDGKEKSRRRPTRSEARNTQVNSFFGYVSRDLESYPIS